MSTDPTDTRPQDPPTGADPGTPAPSGTGDPAAPAAVTRTRSGSTYVFLVVGALVTVALVVFIVQNLDRHRVEFFGLSWDLPLGLNMLIAALAGALITGLVGAVRILQLRRAYRRA